MRLGIGVRLLSLLPAVALLATACSSGATTTNTSSSAKVVSVLAVAGPQTDALIKYAPDFEKSTGNTASIEQVLRSLRVQRKLRELIDNAGLYSVVRTGGSEVNPTVKKNAHEKQLAKPLHDNQTAHAI